MRALLLALLVLVPALPAGDNDAGQVVQLEKVASVGTFRDAAFDVKNRQALVVTVANVPVLERYEYPAFTHTGTYVLLGLRAVSRVAYDPQTKTLHVVRSASLTREKVGPLRETDAVLSSFDISALKSNELKTSGITVRPRRTVKLGGKVTGRAFSADGKWLYFVDANANKLQKLDTTTSKVTKSVAAPSGPLGVCVTPDGKSVWVISGEGDKGRLDRFAAKELKQDSGTALDFKPGQVVATDKGKVCVSGATDSDSIVELLDAEQKYRSLFVKKEKDGMALRLSVDQQVVYMSARLATTGTIYTLPTNAAAKPALGTLATAPVRGTGPRELSVTPDGLYILQRIDGSVWKLPKK